MLASVVTRVGTMLERPGSVRAWATWPCFSLTSYRMVSDLVKQGVRPRTVIDVGANIGQFAVAASRLMKAEVHSFEPLPDAAQTLRRNTSGLNGVVIHEMALGDRSGEVQLNVNRHRHSSSLLPLDPAHQGAFPHAQVERTIQVPMRRLDEVLTGNLPGPVLLKLDVQGFESAVLRGATGVLPKVDFAVLETSFRPMYAGEVVFEHLRPQLESLGFRFVRPVGWLENPKTKEILQMDALFERAL